MCKCSISFNLRTACFVSKIFKNATLVIRIWVNRNNTLLILSALYMFETVLRTSLIDNVPRYLNKLRICSFKLRFFAMVVPTQYFATSTPTFIQILKSLLPGPMHQQTFQFYTKGTCIKGKWIIFLCFPFMQWPPPTSGVKLKACWSIGYNLIFKARAV